MLRTELLYYTAGGDSSTINLFNIYILAALNTHFAINLNQHELLCDKNLGDGAREVKQKRLELRDFSRAEKTSEVFREQKLVIVLFLSFFCANDLYSTNYKVIQT